MRRDITVVSMLAVSVVVVTLGLYASEHSLRVATEENFQKFKESVSEADAKRLMDVSGACLPPQEPATAPAPAAASVPPSPVSAAPVGEDLSAPVSENESNERFVVSSRLSAIEKFVPITPEQKERLKVKFETEAGSKQSGQTPISESLSDIIGEEQANFYQAELKKTFQRNEQREIDKEVYYTSRTIGLNQTQENALRLAMMEAEALTKEELKRRYPADAAAQLTTQEKIRRMIEEADMQAGLLDTRIRQFMTSEQYQSYTTLQAESAAGDMKVWHEVGKSN